MSSSSDAVGLVGDAGPAGDAAWAVELWHRRGAGVPAVPFAAALTGTDGATLADAAAISLAGSREAERLLAEMATAIRMLNTGITTRAQRSEYAVRGPVLWAETLTARANSLGNDDVFVCATAERTFATVENRVLVAALESIAAASRALRGPLAGRLVESEAARVAEAAEAAQRWRRHPRLADVRAGRLTSRDESRLRTGHRRSRMARAFAVRARAAEPFDTRDVARLVHPGTPALHRLAMTVVEVLEQRSGSAVVLGVEDGGLHGAGLSFRHPATSVEGTPGVSYRGVPLLPPEEQRRGADWWSRLPERAITIGSEQDVLRLLERLARRDADRRAQRARRAARAQSSGSSA